MEDNKKKGLGMVLEGGGMRGLYTAGVLDELMEQGIYADSTVGVSAGAIFGCNYKSRQIGRTLRYNTRFCKDKRYMGLKSWITTGDLYSKDFAYGEVPWKLDVFDTETFARSPMKFTVVCTDIETGKPCYQECRMGDRLDVEWMRASASLPLAARPVKLNGRSYRDILEARNKRKRNGEVGRGFIELESADDIYIGIHIAEEIARSLFEDG